MMSTIKFTALLYVISTILLVSSETDEYLNEVSNVLGADKVISQINYMMLKYEFKR